MTEVVFALFFTGEWLCKYFAYVLHYVVFAYIEVVGGKYNYCDCVCRPLSFYKGILPPILAETPKRATKFFTFEQYKRVFLFGAPSPTFVVR